MLAGDQCMHCQQAKFTVAQIRIVQPCSNSGSPWTQFTAVCCLLHQTVAWKIVLEQKMSLCATLSKVSFSTWKHTHMEASTINFANPSIAFDDSMPEFSTPELSAQTLSHAVMVSYLSANVQCSFLIGSWEKQCASPSTALKATSHNVFVVGCQNLIGKMAHKLSCTMVDLCLDSSQR